MIAHKLSQEYSKPNDVLKAECTNTEFSSAEQSLTSEEATKSRKHRLKEVKISTMGPATFFFTTWSTVSDGNSIKVCESEAEISENEVENNNDEESVETCQQLLIQNTRDEDDDNNWLIEEEIEEILDDNSFSSEPIKEEPEVILDENTFDLSEQIKEEPEEVLDKNVFWIEPFKEEPEVILDEITFSSELLSPSIGENYQRAHTSIEDDKLADSTQKIKYHFLPHFELKPVEWFKKEFEEDRNCSATYGRSVTNESHVKDCVFNHVGNAIFQCGIKECGIKFKNKAKLRRHILCHNDDFPLDKCGLKFNNSSELKRHVCTPIKGQECGSELYVCPTCGKNFTHEKRLKLHLSIHRRAKQKSFKCEMNGCGKEFSYKGSLQRHIKSHNDERIHIVYECPLGTCGKKFTRSDNLNNHICSHINANYCSVEGQSYLNEREIRTYICATCRRIFAAKIYLQRHLTSHTGTRNADRLRHTRPLRHKCPLGTCTRKFGNPAHLYNHICRHISKNYCSAEGRSYLDTCKITTYNCLSCEKIFAGKVYLERHTAKHTGNKSFECKVDGCGRKFAYQSSLGRHSRAHRGDKTFVCGLGNCQSAFNRSDVLYAHICGLHISHGKLTSEARSYFQDRNIKIYDCAYCEKVYMQENRYQEHLSLHKNKNH